MSQTPHGCGVPSEVLPGVGSTFPGPFTGDRALATRALYDRSPSGTVIGYRTVPSGYGTDPNVITPTSPWVRVLTQYEKHQIMALSDVILPRTSDTPAPTDVGVVEFFDDWLSAPYDDQVADRELVRGGLQNLTEISATLYRSDFFRLTDPQKVSIVEQAITKEAGKAFFVRFRYLLLGGYFTSDVGMRILGYRGNMPLPKPPELTDETLAIIERELAELGL
jgi:hypothetical protein